MMTSRPVSDCINSSPSLLLVVDGSHSPTNEDQNILPSLNMKASAIGWTILISLYEDASYY